MFSQRSSIEAVAPDNGSLVRAAVRVPRPEAAVPAPESQGFTPLEWLAIAIGREQGAEARGGLTRLLRGIFGGPRVRRMAVDRLEVLSYVAARAYASGAALQAEERARFRAAGFSDAQLGLLLTSLAQTRTP
jgi:hypothetical protein